MIMDLSCYCSYDSSRQYIFLNQEVMCETALYHKTSNGFFMFLIMEQKVKSFFNYPLNRFHVVAYLQQIWWFEVDGTVRFHLPPGVYSLSFRIHLGRFTKRLGRRVCHFELTHGWDLKPVRFSLSTSDGQEASCEYYLDDVERNEALGKHKRGYWIEYRVGEFIVNGSEPSTEIQWSMKQIDCTHSKGGLCVDSVFINPIGDVKEHKRKAVLKEA